MQASQRTVFSAPALVRLLARVSRVEPAESGPSAFEQLREWLRWTDAIALSNVLDAALPASALSPRPRVASDAGDTETRLCAEARTALARAITEDSAFVLARRTTRPGARGPAASVPAPDAGNTIDYATIRQHYVSMQQMMEARVADLRDRVRQRLAARSAPMARLAAIDEIMERALGEREHALLSAVPALLESHFKRLREAESSAMTGAADANAKADADSNADADADADAAAGAGAGAGARASADAGARASADAIAASGAGDTTRTTGAWLDKFRADMQSALHAELAIRFQPVEGLLAALRDR
ncbi:MAG TPA: DUF3348 domain-containing protein [Pararobbsia sp.]|nr:DUF3348 domain-containing protein [Pararobbsia sp.]